MLNVNPSCNELYSAVEDGTEARVRALLEGGADATMTDSKQRTPLHFAAAKGNVAIMRLLLKSGARIDAINDGGNTPLHEALDSRRNAASELIERGADINIKNNKGDTPLHTAVTWGGKMQIVMLLKNGADVNAKNHEGNTALHGLLKGRWATQRAIALLMEKGAELETRNNNGCTALHEAVAVGNEQVIRFLLKNGASINAKAKFGQTALHLAASRGFIHVIRILLLQGANINAKDRAGSTVLHFAARGDNERGSLYWYTRTRCDFPATIRILVQNGLKLDAKDNNGSTALHIAASTCNVEVARILLEEGAVVDLKNHSRSTPLHMAILWATREARMFYGKSDEEAAQQETVQLLLKKGAKVNIKNGSGSTALHISALRPSIPLTQILLENGADVNAKDRSGATALHVAALAEQENRLRFGSYDFDYFAFKTRRELGTVIKFLLKKGADVHTEDIYLSTALHNAASQGNATSTKDLLKAGAHVNARNYNGFTSLDLAESKGHYKVATELRQWMSSLSPEELVLAKLAIPTTSINQHPQPSSGSKRDIKMELPIVIAGATVTSCADTGSEENIMDAGLTEQLGLRVRKEQKDCKSFEIGNGTIVRSIGRTKAYCTFAKDPQSRIKCWFYVFAKLATPLIMGMGFLSHTQTMTKHQGRLQPRAVLLNEIPTVRSIGAPRRRLACFVNGQHVLVNADSGSEIDMMSLSYAKKLGYKVDRRRESRGRVMLADRTVAETVGQVTAGIVLGAAGGQTHVRTFHVLPSLSSDVLLGEDILRQTQAFSTLHSSFIDSLMEGAGPFELNRLIWMGRVEKFIAKSVSSLRSSSRNSQDTEVPTVSFIEQQNSRDARENHRRELERKRISALNGQERIKAEEEEKKQIEGYDRGRGFVMP